VTHIIHAAWEVNFGLPLETFEKVHIAGVRNLIDLALSSRHISPPIFTFVSSVGAAVLYEGETLEPTVGDRDGQILVPEIPIDNPAICMSQGYSQSKYVCERIIVEAVKARTSLRAMISRVGQLSGDTYSGTWARNEYLPILYRSILTIGLAPSYFRASQGLCLNSSHLLTCVSSHGDWFQLTSRLQL